LTVFLHGLGHFHPESEITNRFLEELDIGTNQEWILERVGIRSRRTVLPLDYIRATRNADLRQAQEAAEFTTAELGVRAAALAIERSGIPRQEIGLVLAGSSASDYQSPADACKVAQGLGLEVPGFDVNSACTSLLVQLHLLSLMRPQALPPFVLLVASDSLTKTVDYSDRSAAVLWGDAGAAAVVSTRVPSRARILGSEMESSPAGADKVVVKRGGYFAQDGRAVQTFAIKKTIRFLEALRQDFEQAGRRFHFVGHQANLRMLENVCRRCEIPPERHHSNCEWYGNTGCASSASVISQGWEKWGPLDDVAVVGVGSGLTWARYLIRFGDTA
jgi:3-oxoacyl-[acyl-carrier-protein] synthase-3